MNIKITNNNPYNINYMLETPLQGVLIIISGSASWSGTTNVSGKALDTFNNPPELPYGSYTIISTLIGYETEIKTFNVPETTSLTIVMIKTGMGYISGGDNGTGTVIATTEKYDDIPDVWTPKASLNTTRTELSGFYLNTYGYTIGGYDGNPSAATEKYDNTGDIWTPKANLNIARYLLTGFSLNKYGYAICGWSSGMTTAVEKYDDIADVWTSKASYIDAPFGLTGFRLNNYGYVTGGFTGNLIKTTGKYDDIGDVWTQKANLNIGRYALASFSFNGYGYSITGSAANMVAIPTTEKYDDTANTWTPKTDLNIGRYYPAGFSLNGYGYCTGGITSIDGTGTLVSTTEKYDDITNEWTPKASLNVARRRLAGF